jgi:hypothetical protein
MPNVTLGGHIKIIRAMVSVFLRVGVFYGSGRESRTTRLKDVRKGGSYHIRMRVYFFVKITMSPSFFVML